MAKKKGSLISRMGKDLFDNRKLQEVMAAHKVFWGLGIATLFYFWLISYTSPIGFLSIVDDVLIWTFMLSFLINYLKAVKLISR